MVTTIISFLFKDKYIEVKQKEMNKLYEKQSPFITRVLH